jgi:hypothetical protein
MVAFAAWAYSLEEGGASQRTQMFDTTTDGAIS